MAELRYQVRSSCASIRTISQGCQNIWGWGTAVLPPSRIDNPLQVVVSCLRMHSSVSVPEDAESLPSLPFISTSWGVNSAGRWTCNNHRSSLHVEGEGRHSGRTS